MSLVANPPKILAHVSALDQGNFVTPEYILNKGNGVDINLFRRYCPHRGYPLSQVGVNVKDITCKFHGFQWNENGVPLNNDRKLSCGSAVLGRSNLIFINFNEPAHFWVTDLEKENNLIYSHSVEGSSIGSWLWMMEIQADLLHVRPGEDVIHPWLSSIEDLSNVNMESGEGWIIQSCSTGWWLFIYPFTFIEWSKGCLSVNYTIPKNPNNEFGFDWITQFYYDHNVDQNRRNVFEKLEDVFREDVYAIELQKGPYFPLAKAMNRYEDHCVHFGQWYRKHKIK